MRLTRAAGPTRVLAVAGLVVLAAATYALRYVRVDEAAPGAALERYEAIAPWVLALAALVAAGFAVVAARAAGALAAGAREGSLRAHPPGSAIDAVAAGRAVVAEVTVRSYVGVARAAKGIATKTLRE